MKFNKWTMSLAALGVVSIGSVARAEEAQMNPIQTALASTVISGYVDTSYEHTFDPDKESPAFSIPFRGDNKLNGFNLNVVKLSLEKAMDESEWASGYKVDLLFGPDAVGYNPSSNVTTTDGDEGSLADFAIKQAYVALRTPVGNGIDWKFGVFDTIIGYESFDAVSNPNFTRSWGYAIEPTQHTGLLGTYRINDYVSVSVGLANTLSAGINNRNTELGTESYLRKTWMGSIAVTAPDSMGALAGSTLYAGVVGGFPGADWDALNGGGSSGASEDQINYYAGATVTTPVAGLKLGLALDYVSNTTGVDGADTWVAGLYASYQATEKLSVHGRFEYGNADDNSPVFLDSGEDEDVIGITGTLQYNLWANVVSRVEVRWDKVEPDSSDDETAFSAYLNLIYKF
jgi:hypothetical protein